MVTYKGPAMPSSSSSGECLWDGAHKTTPHPHSQVNTQDCMAAPCGRITNGQYWPASPTPSRSVQPREEVTSQCMQLEWPSLDSVPRGTASASQDTVLPTSPGAASLQNSLVSDPHLQDSWKGRPVWVAIVPQLLAQTHLQQEKN